MFNHQLRYETQECHPIQYYVLNFVLPQILFNLSSFAHLNPFFENLKKIPRTQIIRNSLQKVGKIPNGAAASRISSVKFSATLQSCPQQTESLTLLFYIIISLKSLRTLSTRKCTNDIFKGAAGKLFASRVALAETVCHPKCTGTYATVSRRWTICHAIFLNVVAALTYCCSSERERMKESTDSGEKCIRDASRVDEEGDHGAGWREVVPYHNYFFALFIGRATTPRYHRCFPWFPPVWTALLSYFPAYYDALLRRDQPSVDKARSRFRI